MRIPLFCIATVILVACYQSKEADAPSLENDDRVDIDDSRIEGDAESRQRCVPGSTDPECTVDSGVSTNTETNKDGRLVDLFIEAFRGAIEILCQCALPDDDSCKKNFNVLFDNNCFIDVLNQEREEVEVYVNCITEHVETFSDCVQQHGCDSFSLGQCESKMAASFSLFADSCDEYPNPVQKEIRECLIHSVVDDLGGEVYCLNGEIIPFERICDGEPDCSDGSDETYCAW